MKSKRSQPYQPLLLRIFHGITGLSAIFAILTAFWTYNTYDGRWGKLPLPDFKEIEGIHGTFGLWTLLIFPLFIIYACHRGQQRLIQENSLDKIREINQPIAWYNLHRIINTLGIFSLIFALFSGKMMDENWLPQGELNHIWYFLHLISWLGVVSWLMLHLFMSLKVGGFPLILSMINRKYRAKDSPFLWRNHLLEFKENWRERLKNEWFDLPLRFKIIEGFGLITILLAWIL